MARMLILVYILVLYALTFTARASELEFYKLQEVSIDYKRFHHSARHPLFINTHPKESLNLAVYGSLLDVIGWDNTVQSMTHDGQYHLIGLQMRLYVRITQHIEAGYYHQSQHLLDTTYPHMKFPVEDAWTVKLYLYRRNNKESLF